MAKHQWAGPITTTGKVWQGRGRLSYMNIAETAGNPATVELYDGADTTGQFLGRHVMLASTSKEFGLSESNYIFHTGLYVSVVAGAVKIALQSKAPESEQDWEIIQNGYDIP